MPEDAINHSKLQYRFCFNSDTKKVSVELMNMSLPSDFNVIWSSTCSPEMREFVGKCQENGIWSWLWPAYIGEEGHGEKTIYDLLDDALPEDMRGICTSGEDGWSEVLWDVLVAATGDYGRD